MNRLIDRMKIFFVVVFGIACVAVWTLHLVWIWPGQRCEARGWWWDWRKRVCALGYLREPYADGEKIGYRCAAEPVANYLAKGGKIEETVGRKCLCNALMANIGLEQKRKDGTVEPPLVTVGDDLNTIAQFLAPGRETYSAADVVEALLAPVPAEEPAVPDTERVLAATA